ncbi:hypothetical protein DIPPA_23727 [Diplonema papillatum]|nr:hypothetical protein DIPPA_23727 [Diplonema papillatum]
MPSISVIAVWPAFGCAFLHSDRRQAYPRVTRSGSFRNASAVARSWGSYL